ncbi:hypothetical protein JY463_01235 [Serratia ureilytica]|uniref:hypothetical protein n=1 Tax=Serratia TaxID=613 RepID=UPI001112F831|nr:MULTISPECIES: hypothetical protein [Serratia]MBN5208838.1 hypothetical protein [Serratia ureilytica]MBN5243665.1 hypothetical protein [Serratia ureilytica]
MRVFRSLYEPVNNYLPSYGISNTEEKILLMSPLAWVDSEVGVNVTNNINVTAISDRTNAAIWLPLRSGYMPRLITSANGHKFLNFGLGRGPSAPGAILSNNAYEQLPPNGIFALAMVYRVPLRQQGGYDGTGGNILGNYDNSPNIFRLRFRDDGYRGNMLFLHHGATSPITQSNYPINSTFNDDGLWHSLLLEVRTDMHQIEIDGIIKQQRLVPAIPFANSASRQLIIGGAGNPLSNGFFGDIAMVLIIPGTISAEQKESLYNYIGEVKSKYL